MTTEEFISIMDSEEVITGVSPIPAKVLKEI